ncbi:chlorophyll a/b-binding protein domain-containing protein [Tribonema minus]|uniref:Chlorophyll a/b-binding protein domain-containing protein n=1 Tax=Tribonema minus TaxID=303371 RepID=A0A835YYL0_9STRA|nr:chlorophyll a/b-binding protein domain-containing protein [Tribonema minus]
MSQYDAGVEFAGGLIGADMEAGDFDPLKFSEGKTEQQLRWYREAEITHGRVAMLAALGWIVPDTKTTLGAATDSAVVKTLFGGSGSFDFAADALRNPVFAARAVGPQFFVELFVLAAAIEAYNRVLKADSTAEPGDLSLDPFGLTVPLSEEMIAASDWVGSEPKFRGERFGPDAIPSRVFGLMPSGIRKLKLSEIKHGRLAMLSILGLFLQEVVSGESFMLQMQGYGFNAFR